MLVKYLVSLNSVDVAIDGIEWQKMILIAHLRSNTFNEFQKLSDLILLNDLI